jgi:sugar-specific transcriptional regulator TrmB
MSINTTLKELGLNDKEVEVYLALLKHGKSTPASLSKLTKINRATVYNIAKSLQAKGIIAEDLSGKMLYFTPLPPDSLEQIIKRPIRELQEKESLVKKAIDQLSLITANKEYPVPKIRFVEENNLEDFLYENIEKWQKSVIKSDSVWWGTQDSTFLEYYKKFNDWYWKQPFSQSVKMYQVSNDSPVEQEAIKKYKKNNRDVRFSVDMDFSSSVWVGGDYLIMIVTKQHPFYLVEIHDKTLAHNMREVFKKMWQDSQSPQPQVN